MGDDESNGAETANALASLPVQVLMTQDFATAHRSLAPRLLIPLQAFTATASGSVPVVANALGARLQVGASVDVVVAPKAVIDQLLAQGLVRRDSTVDVLKTPLVLVAPASRPVPALPTPESLRALLLQHMTVLAYPSTDGGSFIEQKLLPQLGIKDAVLPKSIKVFGPQVSQLLARGEASLGLQPYSEAAAAPGITVVGPLPQPLRYETTYTAAIATHANSAAGAQALQHFYRREAAAHDWSGSGWEAVAAAAKSGE